ncbi:hypothetical protein CXF68_08675 [Tenacibaculum sp. Bg11-29]|nr:hypothetical protein CXF68_08675 [Tenacibaculum sp. Bg11-29]
MEKLSIYFTINCFDNSLLFHYDRGIQYASKEFRKLIKSNSLVTQSMSRKRNCWGNAVAKSFF